MTILSVIPLVPAQLEPQIMPPPPAKLVISSEPSGAVVSIGLDKAHMQVMQQRTNATFYVSAGSYLVSLNSSVSDISCTVSPPNKAAPGAQGFVGVKVNSGDTAAINCTAPSGK
ncbi:MAG: hypothetical protein WBA18_05870 [Terracidiphilus sp.]